MCTEEDIDIANRVLQGDTESFRLLVERYEKPVVSMISRLIPDRHACEDVSQDVFLAAYTKLDSFDPARSRFSTWLFTIARNKSINALKKKRPIAVDVLPEPADPRTPSIDLTQKELFDQLDRALGALPGKLKRSFVLAEMEGLPYEEIAQIECAGIGAIKSRISRARQSLQIALRNFVGGPT